MPLSEIENGPIPGYKWTGGPPPEEKNFVPTLHFVEISKDRRVYIGERGQNRIQVFTTEGKWLQDIYVSPNSPAQRGGCGGLDAGIKAPPVQIVGTFTQSICGTTYKMIDLQGPAAEVSVRGRRAQRRRLDRRAPERQDARILWRKRPSGRSDDLSERHRDRYVRQSSMSAKSTSASGSSGLPRSSWARGRWVSIVIRFATNHELATPQRRTP